MRKPKKVFVTIRSVEFEMTYEADVATSSRDRLALFESAHGVMVKHFGLDRKDRERAEGAAIEAPTAGQVLDWLGGLLYDEGDLLLSRIPYSDGPVVRISTHDSEGEKQRLAESERSTSVTAGLREAISIAVNRVPQ